jgi:glycerol uptake facilitator-like aquaporin
MMIDKKNIAMVLAEFLGTAVLSLVILSVRNSAIGIPYFVAIAAGLTVGMVYLNSGDGTKLQINPAVTIALWTVRKINTVEGVLRVAFQVLGGFAALKLFTYFVNVPIQKITVHYSARVMLAEAVGAFIFTLAIAAAMNKNFDRMQLGVFVGSSFVLAMIVASSASNGIVNPAVALAIKSWGWNTYVLGPIAGAVVGMNFYAMVFADKSGASKNKKK